VKVALTIWKNRISPVFDAARQVIVLEIIDGLVVERIYTNLGPEWPYSRASLLSKKGVDVLICGAISLEFRQMLEACGIKVIPFITGELNRVLKAYLNGDLLRSAYFMPGYGRGRRKRFRGGPR
jgi:predicted Fe-Mo cluster-binding NifX family protein